LWKSGCYTFGWLKTAKNKSFPIFSTISLIFDGNWLPKINVKSKAYFWQSIKAAENKLISAISLFSAAKENYEKYYFIIFGGQQKTVKNNKIIKFYFLFSVFFLAIENNKIFLFLFLTVMSQADGNNKILTKKIKNINQPITVNYNSSQSWLIQYNHVLIFKKLRASKHQKNCLSTRGMGAWWIDAVVLCRVL
jgi:hypothetical protein